MDRHGDEVIGSTINKHGTLVHRHQVGKDATLAQIVIRKAQGSKAPVREWLI